VVVPPTVAGEDVPHLYYYYYYYYSYDDTNEDFASLDGDPAEAVAVWRAECGHARDIVARAPSLDQTAIGQPVSLRRILVDMIAEHARHDGHTDLLLQRIDGATGC